MAEIVSFRAGDGMTILVEGADGFGVERVSRGADGVVQASKSLEDAFASARAVLVAALSAVHGLGFEQLSLEFGVKLAAELGAVIAKVGGEAHMTVTATWGRDSSAPGAGE